MQTDSYYVAWQKLICMETRKGKIGRKALTSAAEQFFQEGVIQQHDWCCFNWLFTGLFITFFNANLHRFIYSWLISYAHYCIFDYQINILFRSLFLQPSSHLLSLQFSKVSGRLQLVDATGAIDVVIPDLETSECFQQLCQVKT